MQNSTMHEEKWLGWISNENIKPVENIINADFNMSQVCYLHDMFKYMLRSAIQIEENRFSRQDNSSSEIRYIYQIIEMFEQHTQLNGLLLQISNLVLDQFVVIAEMGLYTIFLKAAKNKITLLHQSFRLTDKEKITVAISCMKLSYGNCYKFGMDLVDSISLSNDKAIGLIESFYFNTMLLVPDCLLLSHIGVVLNFCENHLVTSKKHSKLVLECLTVKLIFRRTYSSGIVYIKRLQEIIRQLDQYDVDICYNGMTVLDSSDLDLATLRSLLQKLLPEVLKYSGSVNNITAKVQKSLDKINSASQSVDAPPFLLSDCKDQINSTLSALELLPEIRTALCVSAEKAGFDKVMNILLLLFSLNDLVGQRLSETKIIERINAVMGSQRTGDADIHIAINGEHLLEGLGWWHYYELQPAPRITQALMIAFAYLENALALKLRNFKFNLDRSTIQISNCPNLTVLHIINVIETKNLSGFLRKLIPNAPHLKEIVVSKGGGYNPVKLRHVLPYISKFLALQRLYFNVRIRTYGVGSPYSGKGGISEMLELLRNNETIMDLSLNFSCLSDYDVENMARIISDRWRSDFRISKIGQGGSFQTLPHILRVQFTKNHFRIASNTYFILLQLAQQRLSSYSNFERKVFNVILEFLVQDSLKYFPSGVNVDQFAEKRFTLFGKMMKKRDEKKEQAEAVNGGVESEMKKTKGID